MNEKDLIYGLAQGDENAFKVVFDLYYSPLVVFATKIIGDLDMSRDLVQDVIVSFFEKRKSIEIHTSLKAHLYQSVRNRCLNYIKREKIIREHQQSLFNEVKENELNFVDLMEETELEYMIFREIKNLPSQCQRIFNMSRFHRFQGKTNQEIADELAISKRTVETQISNALKRLRKNLVTYVVLILIFAIYF
jgi:RNA polymerase sigma-70 factor (ECF subfamily)